MKKNCFTPVILFLTLLSAENLTSQYIQRDTVNGWKITAVNGAVDSACSELTTKLPIEGEYSQSFRVRLSTKNESYYVEWSKEYKPFYVPSGQYLYIDNVGWDLELAPPGYFSLGFVEFFIGNKDTLPKLGAFSFTDGSRPWIITDFIPQTRIVDRMKIRLRMAILSIFMEVLLDNFAFGPSLEQRTAVDGFGDPLTGVDDNNPHPPTDFSLSQNYPNPFNSMTNMKFRIMNNESGIRGWVKLVVYDVLGREVAVLVDSELPAGKYSTTFAPNATLPSGIYLYKLQAGKFSETRKMILLK